MRSDEFEKFSEIWSELHEFMPGGRQLSQRAMTMVFEALAEYPLSIVELAIAQHVKQSKFAPTPSDIVEIITSGRKHWAADEAWGLVLKSFDELETVVMTREMLAAKSQIQEIYNSGDTVGARMAFRAAYDRIIRSSPAPVWQVSAGYDPQRRADAVIEAVNQGLLPRGTENKYLEHAPKDAGLIAGLLTGKVSELPKNAEHLKARWGQLNNALQDGVRKMEEQKRQEALRREQERLEFEERKAEQVKKLAEMVGENA